MATCVSVLLHLAWVFKFVLTISFQTFYVRENGIDLAIVNAIEAIVSCLRSEEQYCVNVPDEGLSMRSLGMT